MRKIDYDKTDITFKNIMINYDKKCKESNVSINFCYNTLMYKFQKYLYEKNLIGYIKKLDFNNKSDLSALKRIVNRPYFQDKENEIIKATEVFNETKLDLFLFLDSTKEPYFFIMSPFYKFGSGIAYNTIPYIKDKMSGTENLNIAIDYSFYKLGYENN